MIQIPQKVISGIPTMAFSLKKSCTTYLEPMLVPPGVKFTNILQAAFSYKSFLRSFYGGSRKCPMQLWFFLHTNISNYKLA
jgi:hypothetical protein